MTSIEYYHTPGEAIGLLILFIVGYCIWLAISSFQRGPVDMPGYQDDGSDDDDDVILPDPPLASGLLGCSPMAWVIMIVLMATFACWYTSVPYRP